MSTIANEVQNQVSEKKHITLGGVLKNKRFLYVVSLVLFFLLWTLAAHSEFMGSSLATPLEVWHELVRLSNKKIARLTLWGHAWASFQRVLIGFSLAQLIGVPLGLAMALNKYMNAFFKPVFDMFKPMPPLAWIAVAILWFGIGETPKIFIIVIGAFVPTLLNAYNGIRLIEPELYDVVRSLGGNRRDEIFQVSFPASFPAIFAGLQISMSIAWTCVLAAELVSARSGLGFIIILGMKQTKPEMILGGMVAIAFVAWLTSVFFTWLERKVCPWKRQIEGL